MKTETTSNKEGVHVCAAPGCGRVLKGKQGRLTGDIRTCYYLGCVQWASRESQARSAS